MTYFFRGLNAGSGINANAPAHIAATIDLSAATWKSVASHEVFTVTGIVRAYLWVECTENCASAGDAATLQFGYEGATDALIGATAEDALDAGDIWYDATPTTFVDTPANVIFDRVLAGLDIGYEIVGEATTDGTLVFHCVWEPLNANASVTLGAGGAL